MNLFQIEDKPHYTFAGFCIGDFLYSTESNQVFYSECHALHYLSKTFQMVGMKYSQFVHIVVLNKFLVSAFRQS